MQIKNRLSPVILICLTGGLLGQTDPRIRGGVPEGAATPEVLRLTLRDAVNRGLARNLAIVSGAEDIHEAHGRVVAAFASFLPDLRGHFSETVQKVNLEALGLPPFPNIPRVIGPFGVFDVRAVGSQNLLNFSAIEQHRASRSFEEAARLTYRDLRDQVIVGVASAYLQALTAHAESDAIQAQLTTAETLYRQTLDQRNAGIAIGIDVLRAQVEMQNQQQRLILSRTDEQKGLLALARAIGLPPGQRITLQPIAENIPQSRSLEDYLRTAVENRSDLKAQAALVRASEQQVNAARAQRLPNLTLEGNIGNIGRTPTSTATTYLMAGAVNVPLFTGGRTRAEIERAEAELGRRRAEYADAKLRVDTEVRSAYLDLQAAAERLKVAVENSRLAAREVEQARDRFLAGVTNNLEVVQAQQTVAAAEDALIVSRYSLELARLATARVAGNAEEAIREP